MDLLLCILVLVLHFVCLLMKVNLAMVNVLTITFLLSNIIIQLIVSRKVRVFKGYKTGVKKVTDKNLNEFLTDYYHNKLRHSDPALSKGLDELVKVLELSGKLNTIGIILIVFSFISYLVYNYFPVFITFNMIMIVILLYVFIRLYTEMAKRGFEEVKGILSKVIIENPPIIIGYILLFCSEAILTFCPILYRKSVIREKLKYIYIKWSD